MSADPPSPKGRPPAPAADTGRSAEEDPRDLALALTISSSGPLYDTGPTPVVDVDALLKQVDLPIGEKLGGRYRIQRVLGRGGMGAVYLAVDEVLDKEVALKLVRHEQAGGAAGLAQLRDEVRLAQRVTHPNVCRTFDLDEAGGVFVVKMEYVDGETLAALVAREGPLPVPRTLALAREVVRGLEAAHARGVVHCDLKPRNILVEHGTGRVVLMDFGIARVVRGGGEAGPLGTPEYMAPEQVRGEAVEPRTDLYALGCVLYKLLVGRVPFSGDTPRECSMRHVEDPAPDPRALRPELPAWLARLVLQLMEKDPARRPPDAGAVLGALAGPRPFPWQLAVPVAAAVVAAAVVALTIGRGSSPRGAVRWHPEVNQDLPTYEENADPPELSPDGTVMTYLSNRDGSWRVWAEPASTGPSRGPARALTPRGMEVSTHQWGRDGQILFTSRDGSLYRMPASGGEPRELARQARYATDCGGRLVYAAFGASECDGCVRILVRDAEGSAPGERELVRLPPGGAIHGLHCDREGRQLAYVFAEKPLTTAFQPSDLYVVPLAGGPPRRLTSDQQANDWPRFHPDGKSIIFSSGRSGRLNLWEIPTGGGEPLQLTTEGPALGGTVTADDQRLYYQVDLTTVHLFAYSLQGGGRRRLTMGDEDVTRPRLSPDGRTLVTRAVRRGKALIMAFPVGEGESRVLAEGESFCLSPDGKQLVYGLFDAAQATSRIWVMPFTGGAPRQLLERAGRVGVGGCDAEGWAYLGAIGSNEGVWKVPLAGGPAVQAAPAPTQVLYPAPTGGWRLALRQEQGMKLTVQALPPGASPGGTGTVEFLAHDVTWMPDGRSVLVWTGDEIRRRNLASGEESLVIAGKDFRGMAVSPDGATLYVAELEGHVRRQVIQNFAARLRPR